MSAFAVVIFILLDALEVLQHDAFALSCSIHEISSEKNQQTSHIPSWSSGNDPRSGGVTLNVVKLGGLPNDMMAGRGRSARHVYTRKPPEEAYTNSC